MYFIQYVLGENIFLKVAPAKASKEKWEILKQEFDEKNGSDISKKPAMSNGSVEEAA